MPAITPLETIAQYLLMCGHPGLHQVLRVRVLWLVNGRRASTVKDRAAHPSRLQSVPQPQSREKRSASVGS